MSEAPAGVMTAPPSVSRKTVSRPQQNRVMMQAALLMLAYAVIQVVVNGIVLDETVIASQIIVGSVKYDAGHPHATYYTQAFSLAHYLSALASWLHVSDTIISAVRNVLMLFIATYAVFALAFVLSGRAVWGYVAAALLVAEANLRLSGNYPLLVFPHVYSNGQIGLYALVLIAALLLGGMWRSSALLLGLMPGIHATFAMMLWPWAGLLLVARKVHHDPEARRDIVVWGGLGLAVCVALYALIRIVADDRPPVTPYDVAANVDLIRQQFTIWTDRHRAPVQGLSFEYLANAVLFFTISGILWSRARLTDSAPRQWQAGWLLGLGVWVWGYIYGTRLLQGVTGSLPQFLLMSMPARFSNISAVLLLPLAAAALGVASAALDARRRALLHGVLGLLLLGGAVAAADVISPNTHSVYSRNVLFAFVGMLLASEWVASSGRHRILVLLGTVLLAIVLATFIRFTNVVVYFAAAALATAVLLRWLPEKRLGTGLTSRLAVASPEKLLAPGLVLLALAVLPGRTADPVARAYTRIDMKTPETRALAEWFRANARPEDAVLTIFVPNPELQVQTGQPVLFEHKTLWIMSYMRDLAPAIGTMAKDLYGVDYEDPAALERACGGRRVSIYCDVWWKAWVERTPEQWRELGRKYRFHLVLSASFRPLQLPVAVAGERWTLYTIE